MKKLLTLGVLLLFISACGADIPEKERNYKQKVMNRISVVQGDHERLMDSYNGTIAMLKELEKEILAKREEYKMLMVELGEIVRQEQEEQKP